MHEHKQTLALQALSHAKGHYLAAVSFNRSVAGWETDPGSVPSLRGRTIWQLQQINMSAACTCAHTYECANVCVSGGLVYQTPSEKMHAILVPLQHPFSLLSIWPCVCLPVCLCVRALPWLSQQWGGVYRAVNY